MKKRNLNIILLMLAGLVLFGPMLIFNDAEFRGTDNKAGEVISEIAPDYNPWTENVWRPQSSEVESYLFALQAGVGSFIIGYIIGFGRGKKTGKGN